MNKKKKILMLLGVVLLLLLAGAAYYYFMVKRKKESSNQQTSDPMSSHRQVGSASGSAEAPVVPLSPAVQTPEEMANQAFLDLLGRSIYGDVSGLQWAVNVINTDGLATLRSHIMHSQEYKARITV